MAQKHRIIRLLGALVLMVMLTTTVLTTSIAAGGTTYYGSSPSISNVSGSIDLRTQQFLNEQVMYKLPDTIKIDDELSIIVKMHDVTLLDAYDACDRNISFTDFVLTDEAEAVRQNIRSKSDSLLERLDNIDYSLGESYNVVMSGFEIKITAEDFAEVCSAIGKDATVIIGEEYYACDTRLVENSVNVYGTGIFDSSNFEFDGTGMVVAVLDTGLDYYHSAFLDKNFTNAGKENNLGLTFSQVSALIANNDMAAEGAKPGLTAEDVYISDKVPFGFDYADGDSDVFPLLSNHGTHVSGVIAGNHLSHIESEDYSGEFVGVAPGAQIAAMKIFSDTESTSHASWILAALEDCVTLGVDVINMSIGTTAGFSRETDKEQISGVYDDIRARGISLVVAASNSFNSGYSSDKNGNLPLTSNPDSATVGSPSTYKGALCVASIEGAKTPYLTFGETIMYFVESTDRYSEEKNFVNELLSTGRDTAQIEYVLIAGAGRTAADYTGIDVKGKIALIKRGYNTFEEKVALAEKMGAAGVIIYNNVSGEIKMNVGETSLPVCSISQNDGEMLAEAKSGTITISRSQTSGPFISDFSSWGPTPDLEIKPEITAHGGSILSSVPGESYDRISGTSMATPNISGVAALLREYVIQRFGYDRTKDAVEITATVNRLMMSTADIILNKNGLPYSVRKQGAGLANLTDCADTNAYILTYNTDGSIMDKSKLDLGDDPTKSGSYTLKFAVLNFGNSSLSYDLSAYVLTEGVSETKTAQGETTVTEEAFSLDGASVEIVSVNGGSLEGNKITVGAGQTANVTVKIRLSDENKQYLNDSFENGMYVEGFVMLKNADKAQDLNIPYLAFYGDWTRAPLFDIDYYETNADELDDSIDPLDKTLADAFATRPIGGSTDDYVSYLGSYYFEQAPGNKIIAADRKYIALSNQSANNEINSLRFVWAGLLRNAERVEVIITEDSTGEVVFRTTDYDIRKSYGDGGPIRPSNIDIEFSAIEENLKNNTQYTVTLKGYVDYADGGIYTNLNNTFSFPLTTDFSAPVLSDCEFYTEFDRSTKSNRLFARLAIYDNHYSMAMQAGYVGETVDENGQASAVFNAFGKYATPIYSDFNSTSYVVYELTDYIDDIVKGAHDESNTFTVALYDYAMNSATYEIALPDDFRAFGFVNDEGAITTDLKITLSPNEIYNITPVVYPESEWGELITYNSNNPNSVRVVNNQIVAIGGEGAIITAQTPDDKLVATITVDVLSKGDPGFKEYSRPVAQDFALTGYYVNKAFYMMDNTQRDIGETGSEMKFVGNIYALSMYPSESVTLRYELDAYFPRNTRVEFSSSNEDIVKIASDGTITAVAEGMASVTAKVLLYDSPTLLSATVSINVKDPFVNSGPSLTHYYGAGDSANHVIFPSTVAVTEIGEFAFSNSQYIAKDEHDEISDESPETMKMWYVGDNTIRKVTIPEGVTRIGPYAFAGMTALTEVVLPSTLETIDFGAFIGCTRLQKVTGIEHVKFINNSAFAGCSLTGRLNLDSAVAIADYAFERNKAITSVKLPATLQSLGAYAFGMNTKLQSVEIEAEKIKLGQYAFTDCTSLTKVTLNTAVIPTGAFNMCTSLANMTLGKDVAVISEYAFRNTKISRFDVDPENSTFTVCDGGSYLTNAEGDKLLLVAPAKTELVLRNYNIKSIGNAAFSGSNRLTRVYLPGVTEIGDFAFSECDALTEYTFGALTKVGRYAFENTAISSFDFNGVEIGEYAFFRSKIESVSIPDGYVIPTGAFANCQSLHTIVIGNDVTIGDNAFYNDAWHSESVEENRTFYGQGTKPVDVWSVVYDSPIRSLTIGDNAIIGGGAFYGAAKVERIELGANAVVGDYAFYNCSSLKQIYGIAQAITIGEAAFSGDIHFKYQDEGCTKVDITPEGEYRYTNHAPRLSVIYLINLEKLGPKAFAACEELTTVHLGSDLYHIPASAFQSCEKLSRINLERILTVGEYAFAECDLKELDLSSARQIDEYAFCNNLELASILLDRSSIVIEEGAFSYCKKLSEIRGNGTAGIKSVGDYAFAYTALTELDLSGAEYIGTHSFYMENRTELKVKLGNNLKDIGDNPFANCVVAPFSTKSTVSFGDKVMDEVISYTFDISDTIKIIDGSIYRVVPKGLELILWSGDDIAVVADNTVRISAMAFIGDDVKQVVLPSTVAAIGHKAFYGCDNLVFITFQSYKSPMLEEEYDSSYYESMEHIPASGDYDFADYYGNPLIYKGNGTVPYFMWNVTSLPSNFFYGANFVDYVGYVDKKITMIRPSNGKYYDSFILNNYFDLRIDGTAAADDVTLAAIEMIKQIPTETKQITLAHKSLIEAARAAYNKIASDEQRALVPASILEILTNAERRISDLEYLLNNNQAVVTPPAEKISLTTVLNIVIGVIFILVVVAFIVVLVVFIKLVKSGAIVLPKKDEKPKEKSDGDDTDKKTDEQKKIYYEVEKAPPVPKLKKKPPIKIADFDDIVNSKGELSKRKIILIVASVATAVILVAGVIWAIIAADDSFYSSYEEEGYTVSVTYDAGGGTFKGSDSTVVDLFKPEQIGSDGLKLLSPDDPRRDESNALTITKAGCFLAGWYTERTLIDPNDESKGYTYSGKWDFEKDRLQLEAGKEYTADESALTLYAAWVPYYKYEIYTTDEKGETVLVGSTSAINLTIPEWHSNDVYLDMDNFPEREGYTLDRIFTDEAMTKPLKPLTNEDEDKKYITGQWDEATATSLTPVIKLYTTWTEGKLYRVRTAEELKKNADLNGYYEILSNIDFKGADWPAQFLDGKFNGKIFGSEGRSFTISNVSFSSTSKNRINNGIFSSIGANASIENISFVNITHTVNIAITAPDATFGLLAGSIESGASFNNVTVSGRILIGNDCASLIGKDNYTISLICGEGEADGVIAENIKLELSDPQNAKFEIKENENGSFTIVSKSN